jgi:DNA excision repair protein ERCC-3
METDAILDVMDRFSKNRLPDRVTEFVRDCTLSYGKVKLVLKENRYFIESSYPEVLRMLLKDELISSCRIMVSSTTTHAAVIPPTTEAIDVKFEPASGAIITIDQEDDAQNVESDFVQSIEIGVSFFILNHSYREKQSGRSKTSMH